MSGKFEVVQMEMQEAFKTVYQKFNEIDEKFKRLNDRFDHLEQ